LWYDKRARFLAQSIDDPRPFRISQERLDFFLANAIQAEAVAYHNLKLYRDALRLCQMAEETAALRRNPGFWKPHLYRDVINALEGIPRFSITLAENLANQVRHICDTRADNSDGLLLLLVLAALARAYIRHQNFKDAHRVLAAGMNHFYKAANVGPLHQVISLRTFARLYSEQGACGPECKYFVHEASRIASQAGLAHQLNEIRAEFKSRLESSPSSSQQSEEQDLPERLQAGQ